MQTQWMDEVLDLNGVYSFPVVSDQCLAKARQVNLVEANAILRDSARTLVYFQVAAVNLKAKRQVKTSSH